MSRASKGFRIAGNLIKFTAAAVVAGVIALLLWRIYTSGTPSDLKAMIPNDRLSAAYGEQGDDLYIFKQDHKSITTAKRNYGYFAITDYYIIPEADQIQLVFRYNNSTIRSLAEDYKLDKTPATDAKLFDLTLVLQTDLTPDDDGDNAGDVEGSVAYERIFPVAVEHEQTNLYNYFRYVFIIDGENGSLSEMLDSGELLAVYADIFYVEDINYDSEAYGTLFLYDYKTDTVRQRLSLKDKNAIKSYVKKG